MKPIDLNERRKRLIMSEPEDGLSAGPELKDWAKYPLGQTPPDYPFIANVMGRYLTQAEYDEYLLTHKLPEPAKA